MQVTRTQELKKLGEYHGLYVHCNTYLLADAFNNII